MIWNNWHDFFAMGGYALYVWGSVLMVALCMFGEVALVRMRHRAIRAQISTAQRRKSS